MIPTAIRMTHVAVNIQNLELEMGWNSNRASQKTEE
jgi:hypothetical protein